MSELPMPSEVRGVVAREQPLAGGAPAMEPPSVKMIVRLFLIPLLIAAAVVGIMLPIAHMTESPVSLDQAIARLKNPGGERTFNLVGPGSKQRYMDAKT